MNKRPIFMLAILLLLIASIQANRLINPIIGFIDGRAMVILFDTLAHEGKIITEITSCKKHHVEVQQLGDKLNNERQYCGLLPQEAAQQAFSMASGELIPYNHIINVLTRVKPREATRLGCIASISNNRTTITYPSAIIHLALLICDTTKSLKLDRCTNKSLNHTNGYKFGSIMEFTNFEPLRLPPNQLDALKILNTEEFSLHSMPRGAGLSFKQRGNLRIYYGCSNTSREIGQIRSHEILHEVIRSLMYNTPNLKHVMDRLGPSIYRRAQLDGAWQKIYDNWQVYTEELIVRACVPLLQHDLPFLTDFPFEQAAITFMTQVDIAAQDLPTRLKELLKYLDDHV